MDSHDWYAEAEELVSSCFNLCVEDLDEPTAEDMLHHPQAWLDKQQDKYDLRESY